MPADITGTNILVEEDAAGASSGSSRADLRQHRPRRRDQPRHAEDPVEPARGDAGAPGHGRRQHATQLEPPFFVLATQNPLEMEGTYPLPEAQLDRFFFKVVVPFPSEEDLIAIIDRTTGRRGADGRQGRRRGARSSRCSGSPRVPIAPHVTAYAVRVLQRPTPTSRARPARQASTSATAARRAAPRRS